MSKMFPDIYAVFFIVQLAALMVVYGILRLLIRLKKLTSLCLSILVVAGLTLLLPLLNYRFFLFPLNYRFFIRMNPIDLQEYMAGTLIVAIPFLLILTVQFLTPLLRELAARQQPAGAERIRILGMIEEGKITAEEGSDLLEAMGRSNALRGQDRFSRLDIAILGGVALVIMGFFMPWVYIHISGAAGMERIGIFRPAYQAGYHTGAIGWTIFVVALVSAVPVFVTPENFLYKISILHLFLTLIGFLLALIALLRMGSHFGVGIIICMAGFVMELIASGAKFKRLTA